MKRKQTSAASVVSAAEKKSLYYLLAGLTVGALVGYFNFGPMQPQQQQ